MPAFVAYEPLEFLQINETGTIISQRYKQNLDGKDNALPRESLSSHEGWQNDDQEK
jgi:hypothetical protein